jgi:hypothetical protein
MALSPSRAAGQRVWVENVHKLLLSTLNSSSITGFFYIGATTPCVT